MTTGAWVYFLAFYPVPLNYVSVFMALPPAQKPFIAAQWEQAAPWCLWQLVLVASRGTGFELSPYLMSTHTPSLIEDPGV